MRILITLSSLALLTACGQATQTETPAPAQPAATVSTATETVSALPVEDVKVLAVMSYADWCGSCKALDPKVEAVRQDNTFNGVKFAKLDYSDRDDAKFFTGAAALGVEAAFRAEFSEQIKTGKLYLISAETGEILSRVDKTMEPDAITLAISEAAA